jgi:hypothetical protein
MISPLSRTASSIPAKDFRTFEASNIFIRSRVTEDLRSRKPEPAACRETVRQRHEWRQGNMPFRVCGRRRPSRMLRRRRPSHLLRCSLDELCHRFNVPVSTFCEFDIAKCGFPTWRLGDETAIASRETVSPAVDNRRTREAPQARIISGAESTQARRSTLSRRRQRTQLSSSKLVAASPTDACVA